MPIIKIESFDQEGQGVAHDGGKAIFIENALPGEVVEYKSVQKKSNFERARIEKILLASHQRVQPPCSYFGICGGCRTQHLEFATQLAAHQRALEDALWHIGKLHPQEIYRPITGATLGYRRRARLSVRYIARKGGVLVGFHERAKHYVADIDSCAVLTPKVGQLIPELKKLISAFSIAQQVPQIEVAAGDEECAIVFRHLAPLSAADENLLRTFSRQHQLQIYLQPHGPESAWKFFPTNASALSYTLPEWNLRYQFSPTDFVQVHADVNRLLIRNAMKLLQPAHGEIIADMFCGLGNFSLPMAKMGAQVFGFEGSVDLLLRAQTNAEINGLNTRCTFTQANLFDEPYSWSSKIASAQKMLIDPPREGAYALVQGFHFSTIEKIVYISCNPATFARDSAILTTQQGFVLRGAGIAAMFPHTAHCETIALFERD